MPSTRLARVGSLREQIASLPRGPQAATPEAVSSALASLQAALRHIGRATTDDPHATAVVAVPHAARGLVLAVFEGAPFEDGIPGETAATVAAMDALDRDEVF